MLNTIFPKLSKSEHQILAVCQPIRNELLPIIYNKKSVELRTSPFYDGECPWAIDFLKDLGSNAKFLASIKIVQILYGSRTLQHIRPWAHSLKALFGTLQSCCNIQFEAEDPGPLSPSIFIDVAFWNDQAATHYLQAKVPKQMGPELVFEYRLEHLYGQKWTISHLEELCAIHRALWKVPGQRFTLR